MRKFVFDWTNSKNKDNQMGSINDWGSIMANYSVDPNDRPTIKLPIPIIKTAFGAKNSTSYEAYNYCTTKVVVYRKPMNSNIWQVVSTTQVNPARTDASEGGWVTDWKLKEAYGGEVEGYGTNRTNSYIIQSGVLNQGAFESYYKKFAEFDNAVQNRQISITLEENYIYKVVVGLWNFDTPSLGLTSRFYSDGTNPAMAKSAASFQEYASAVTTLFETVNTPVIMGNVTVDGQPMIAVTINAYEKNMTQSYQFQSAPNVSAYDLFIEAQMKSQIFEKEDGVYIKDMTLPYYCAPEDVDILKNTQIIENAYIQKNFWEVLLEIGKYLHAIPYIEFGEDDRFIVKWKQLGKPIEYDGENNPIINTRGTIANIYNSKSIENYVSALNSYVNNMVQLGGKIGEWVAPKSESEDYLVYNDVAVIKTSRPIIEILSLKARCIQSTGISGISLNQEVDITNYVYEKNVYDLLDVTGTYDTNKGYAIYYNLGENVIRGLNYRLPTVSVGDKTGEYAIKRILGKAYIPANTNKWSDIQVNCFAFYIEYRTKESIRSEHSRPDLRKYLINSKYENIPYHKQFNNQQDKMVDSTKFGNQMYGKLIKTGNLEYTTNEWVEFASAVKRAGDLYVINGEIYYISKVETTYLQDHATCHITYSKDYNQLSDIIGIPSEPRFYEISERNVIDRNVSIDDYILLTTDTDNEDEVNSLPRFRIDRLLPILLGDTDYPKYVVSEFKNDLDNPNPTTNAETDVVDIMKPVTAFSMRNTLSFKWEMEDNFSAGDQVNTTNHASDLNTVDTAYAQLYPTQYTDSYGRRDLFNFAILDDLGSNVINNENIKGLPISPYRLWLNNIDGGYVGYATRYKDNDNVYHDIDPLEEYIPIRYNTLYNGSTQLNLSNGDYFVVDDGNYCAMYYYYYSLSQAGGYRFFLFPTGADLTKILEMLRKKTTYYSGNDIAILKDAREKMAFNYNVQMITDSDRFVLSGYMWQQKASGDVWNPNEIQLALLDREVNKISNDTILTESILAKETIDLANDVEAAIGMHFGYRIKINDIISRISNHAALLTQTKAIAFITKDLPEVGNGRDTYFIIARNVTNLQNSEAPINSDWYLCKPKRDFFKQQ